MGDFRVDIDYFDHPKTVALVKQLGWPGVISHLRLLAWVAKYRPRGVLTGMSVEDVAIAAKWTGPPDDFVRALRVVRFLDKTNKSTFEIHDWSEWNPWVFHRPERTKTAKAAAEARWNDEDTKPRKSKTAKAGNDLGDTPSPSPSPSPSPKSIYEELRALYNDCCTSLVKCEEVSEKRRRNINARFEKYNTRGFWESFFKRCEASDWLTGRTARSSWKADFGWIIDKTHFLEIIEGKYDNRKEKRKGRPPSGGSFSETGETSL